MPQVGWGSGRAPARVPNAGICGGLYFGPFYFERKQIYAKHHGSGFKQRGCAVLCASRIFTVIRQDDICPVQIINKG